MIAARQRPQDPELALEAGSLSGNAGLYDDALVWFKRAETLQPTLIPAVTGQGQMWMALSRPLMAVRAYERALKLAPSEPRLLVELARANTVLRDFPAAVRYAEMAQDLAPESPDVYRTRATLDAEMLDVPGSLKNAERATQLGPTDPQNWIISASLLLRNRRLPEAQAAIERALRLDPGSPVANVVYATVLVDRRQTADTDRRAFAALARGRTVEPGYAPAVLLQGQIALRGGQLPLAISLLRQAHEADPRDPEALRALGQALIRAGRAEEGVRLTGAAQKLPPRGINFSGVENQALKNGDPALVVRLAELYERQRMYDSAINVLERALVKNPKHPELKAKLAASRRAAEGNGPTVIGAGHLSAAPAAGPID
ncbi:MAG: tetratricopeptide repeat protein [Actinomycetota bacterium]